MPSTRDVNPEEPRERRLRVVGERVSCRRIGPTDVRRCAECIYLLRLGRRYIVCIDGDIPEEPEFGW